MTLVLDAGALLAIERADRETLALLKRELTRGVSPVTHGGFLDGCGAEALDVLLATDGDLILTSDPDDLRALAASAALHVDRVPV